MGLSDVAICNIALSSHLGAGTINSLNEQSPEAAVCNLHYEPARDMVLQSYPWSFAQRVEPLAPLSNDRPQAWAQRYARPAACLKLLRITPTANWPVDAPLDAYQLLGQSIYCNIAQAYIEYTFLETDVSKYPPLFAEALAVTLAARMAMPITRNESIRKNLANDAAAAMIRAQTADANERGDTANFRPGGIQARG